MSAAMSMRAHAAPVSLRTYAPGAPRPYLVEAG
jgi:hypothetical protein